jgi:iron complex outermembrane receptor protein
VGTKIEASSVNGANLQPAVRAVWQPTVRQSLWAASARAVRTVNRVERDLRLTLDGFQTPDGPVLVQTIGNPDATSEALFAHELGYRHQLLPSLWFDVATFYNVYDHLISVEAGTPFFNAASSPPYLVVPAYFESDQRGTTRGVEISVHYQVMHALRLEGNYSRLQMDLRGPRDPAVASDKEGESPQNKSYLGAVLTLPRGIELSGDIYVTGAVPTFAVPAYTRLDLTAAWRVRQPLRLRVTAQNLLGTHVEHGAAPSPANVVKRAVHIEAVFDF